MDEKKCAVGRGPIVLATGLLHRRFMRAGGPNNDVRRWPMKFKLRDCVITPLHDQTPAVTNRLQQAKYEIHFVGASVYKRLFQIAYKPKILGR
jgi:hypothetical protein